jgi:radical SAM protein with 4Fe4S-binding SPASM domain
MKQMPIEDVEKIFRKLIIERQTPNGVVHPQFNLFLTTHYSEVLLYKDFEKLLELAKHYGLKTFILSNGVNLTPDKVDIINKYVPSVIEEIGLNVPVVENAELWSKRSGFPAKRFDDLMKNIEYLHSHAVTRKLQGRVKFIINGVNEVSFKTGSLQKGPKFDDLDINLDLVSGEHQTQVDLATKMFPNFEMEKSDLIDRTGLIADYISEAKYMEDRMRGRKVIGCQNWGDRIYDWLSINSNGDAILCCNDYNFDYVFGNVLEQELSEMWLSDRHVETIDRAYNNICTKCSASVTK